VRFAPLSDVADLNPRHISGSLLSELVSFVPMAAVLAETASTEGISLRPYGEVAKGYTPMRNGDLLVAKITPCFENGKIAHATLPTSIGFGSTEFHVVRARGDAADARYLLHFLRQKSIRIEGERRMTGSGGQRRVPVAYLAELKVPLPTLVEQRRIAKVLDRAETLRAQRRQALAQLDALAESIFVHMFGDPISNSNGWSVARIDEVCSLVRGSSPRPQGDPLFFGGPVPRLMVADITRDGWLVTPRIDSLTIEGAKLSRPVPSGTVVMAVSGNVGLVSRLAVNACVHDGFVAFTGLDEQRCDPGYLLAVLHFMKSTHEQSKAGAIFINLTTTDIKAMRIPLPPRPLQEEFVYRLAQRDKMRTVMNIAQEQSDALFASLQHRAFRGEL
jgi:type I restriction enzyme, S subunit